MPAHYARIVDSAAMPNGGGECSPEVRHKVKFFRLDSVGLTFTQLETNNVSVSGNKPIKTRANGEEGTIRKNVMGLW